jgi:hypothetical protein
VPAAERALLELRTASFGNVLAGFAECDGCGERLEFGVPAAQLAESLAAAEEECTLETGGQVVRLRLARLADLAHVAAASDLDNGLTVLMERCVTALDEAGRPISLADVSPQTRAAALARLEEMHEAAELSLTLECPSCAASQRIVLDVAAFLWAELRSAAQRLLDEVHELAWAYGWAESAILAMSPQRRQAYLERVRG